MCLFAVYCHLANRQCETNAVQYVLRQKTSAPNLRNGQRQEAYGPGTIAGAVLLLLVDAECRRRQSIEAVSGDGLLSRKLFSRPRHSTTDPGEKNSILLNLALLAAAVYPGRLFLGRRRGGGPIPAVTSFTLGSMLTR